ncbi:MAG: ribonuclease R [Gammaproteobacteria bacterium]|nr:ribonuclease R [Gammaproteobacteria bacterium]MCF6363708.1 ribonuclease R [Gammaproteobacteria bacterium]
MTKRKKKTTVTDPHAEREARKYENPIPSRELILELLEEAGEPLVWQQVAERLGLDDEESQIALTRRLRAMERDGQLVRNRRNAYGPLDKMDLVRGRIIAHPDGFGFLVPDDGSDDLFMGPRDMRALFHGDRVVAHVSGIDRRGRREGAVVDVLERNTHQIVGRLLIEGGIAVVAPDSKRITHDILIPAEELSDAREGQIVMVEVVEQPSRRRQPIGRILEVLGEHMAPGMEIDIAARAHALPYLWPQGVEDEVAGLKPRVLPSHKKGREDIRELPLVTIDGEDARDFDDAVYCEPQGSGWRLLVAIADVSHYVSVGSALDAEAIERGNSVYFPGRVIPMLPEVLSNGLCSINPKVDRLCMVCEMQVSSSGKVKSHRFFEGLMRSHARLTYDKVAAILDGQAGLRKTYARQVPHLENLHDLFQVFIKQRKKRGAIEFETTETRIVFGDDKKIERIEPLMRNDAHKMIEECMIAANVEAAKFLAKHKMPTLFRVHDTPKETKLIDLRAFLAELGLDLPGGDKPSAKDYATLLESVRERPDAHLIQTVLLRSMNQAVYQPENLGHFGLSLEEYAHFTSPIRRYPDLLVHRGIRHILRGGKAADFDYAPSDMQNLGERCSMTERRADEATRDATDWLKCEYVMDKVGEVFPGIITSVTGFGLFVELDDIYVEGLVHVTSLTSDYYHFDPAHHIMRGERTGKHYRLGDTVEVRVVRVDLDEKKIDFEMADKVEGEQRPERKKKTRKRHKKKPGKGALPQAAAVASEESAQGGEDEATDKPKKKKKRRRRSKKKGGDTGAQPTEQASNESTKTVSPASESADKPAKKKRRRRPRRKPKPASE